MCLVNAVENVAARTRARRELGYEGKQKVMTGLLVEIPEIEVEVGHDGRSRFADSHNVLNDGGTDEK